MHAMKLLELGLTVRLFEAGAGVGGTWYWNRYPGARFDSESWTYGYSFSQELLEEWHWQAHFAPQPETGRYLNHVADEFDLRRHIQFESRVASAFARDLYVAKNGLDKEEALGRHWAAQQRTLAVSRDPNRSGGSHILFYDHAGSDTENSMLYGTPDDIADKLTSFQRVGIKYIILNIGGMSRDSLRSFAREIMPAFTDGPSQE
jgi:alkanesulfonate monooxygenase SsuD/methylene tetrahydromethanopterin reductase-like flavin-dependent oxidoreductase (luciferase family)